MIEKQHKVLVVDDDPIVLEFMKDLLSDAGYHVFQAMDWRTTTQCIYDLDIVVVVLDVHLPGVRGDALIPFIHNLKNPEPSIVLFSGMPGRELRRLTREVNAANFITKGTDRQRILEVVAAAVEKYCAEREASSAPPRGAQAPAEASAPVPETPFGFSRPLVVEPAGWVPRVLVVDDSPLRREVLRELFEGPEMILRLAESGEEALRIMLECSDAERPHMVVSDIRMPGMTGLQLTRALRQDPRMNEVPILLYTTSSVGLDEVFRNHEAEVESAAEVLRGPVAFQSLPAAVERRIETLTSIRRLRAVQERLRKLSSGGAPPGGGG